MSSKFSNKFPIPEKFPEILHDYAREVVRYMPKDILDFSIQYFYSLDQNIPLNYMEGASKDLPKLSYALEQKEKSKENRETLSTPSLATNNNTQNMFYKQTDVSAKKIENEIKEIKETNSSRVNSPRLTEESKREFVYTNGSGVVDISKKFVANIFDDNFGESVNLGVWTEVVSGLRLGGNIEYFFFNNLVIEYKNSLFRRLFGLIFERQL